MEVACDQGDRFSYSLGGTAIGVTKKGLESPLLDHDLRLALPMA
jgi:hypothetical protein